MQMARKKLRRRAKKKEAEDEVKFERLNSETKHSIWAIFSFASSLLFVLAAYGQAGLVGERIYGFLELLFGRAFFLVPLVFFLAGLSFIFSLRAHLVATTVGGGVLMLFSALGIFDAVFGEKTAGFLGFAFSLPLLKLFDFWATLVILFALVGVSFLLMLNVSIKPRRWFAKKEETEPEEADSEVKESPSSAWSVAKEIPGTVIRQRFEDNAALEGLKTEEVPKEEPEAEPDEERMPLNFAQKNKNSAVFLAVGGEFKPPPLDLLENDKGKPSSGDIKANSNIIKRTLQNFGIVVEMGEINVGPSITQYTLRPAEGIKLSRITGLQNDLSLALAAHPIRIEAPIPGKSLVGVEIPNKSIALVGMGSILSQEEYAVSPTPLLLGLGRDVTGRAIFADLCKMPHLLVAGSTGSGKSVAIHAMMMSLLFRNPPERLRFLMIDPKRVELSVYSGIPHILTPVITDSKKAIMALRWAVKEMERRYELLAGAKVRDIKSYQPLKDAGENPMPYIIVVIDELADMMAAYPREMEASIVRLAQMSRAVGIHLVVSTQRPSVEVITGLIKANITSRIAFQVASQVDSRTILDMAGSEKLLGNGDMLYLSGDTSKPKRLQGAFVSESEVRRVTQHLEAQYAQAEFGGLNLEPESSTSSIFDSSEEEDVDDELYKQAEEVVMQAGKASASYLQRRLRVGYARAARLLDIMESRGIIGPADGAKPRDVLTKKGAKKEESSSEGENEEFSAGDKNFFDSF
ncbi:MAG: DNA translocase FtsK [Candidatus Niyogibacteria bacterium]|nr:MAG: DNA translocase FtsK [Candidatus Niyogibacteria bacterium]